MVKNKKNYWKCLKSYLNLHIDLSTVVVILLIIFLFNRLFLQVVLASIDFMGSKIEFPPWLYDISVGFLANILALLFVAYLVFWIFRLRTKSALCGKFKAYDIVDDKENYWGDVSLTYNIFSNRIRGCLRSNEYDADIIIEAVFERGEYLRGHYIEKKKLTRRRMGAFLLMLDGEGDSYSGSYVFVDPYKLNFLPQTGKAKWVKESTF